MTDIHTRLQNAAADLPEANTPETVTALALAAIALHTTQPHTGIIIHEIAGSDSPNPTQTTLPPIHLRAGERITVMQHPQPTPEPETFTRTELDTAVQLARTIDPDSLDHPDDIPEIVAQQIYADRNTPSPPSQTSTTTISSSTSPAATSATSSPPNTSKTPGP